MTRKISLNLNRVEGDLDINVEVADGHVQDAWCSGTLYRGFEQIMVGRDPMDSLVITPRICGICGTAHLYSAVMALEHAFQLEVPANATRIRNLCLLTEEVQSDCRQTFLMFTIDFAREAYSHLPNAEAVQAAFAELNGSIYQETIRHSRKILEIVALFGGQWPHSSYMVPGGVTTPPSMSKLAQAKAIIANYRSWFERDVIGGKLSDWLELSTCEDFENWISGPAASSAVALFTQFLREIGLHKIGFGTPLYMSYGSPPDPEKWSPPYNERNCLRPAGIYDGTNDVTRGFDQGLIAEDLSHSWFHETSPGPKHPFEGETLPKYQAEGERYSWAKAPRYGGDIVQVGPIPQLLAAGDALTLDLYKEDRGSSWLRQFCRFQRQAQSIRILEETIDALLDPKNASEPYLVEATMGDEGEGFGMIEAARGSLGHWIKIKDGKIDHYQIVTPTAWNASPRDAQGRRGHWEESLIGLPLENEDDPLMLGHVIRSHDPCLVCTVHVAETDQRYRFGAGS